jgi:hypothetical protein
METGPHAHCHQPPVGHSPHHRPCEPSGLGRASSTLPGPAEEVLPSGEGRSPRSSGDSASTSTVMTLMFSECAGRCAPRSRSARQSADNRSQSSPSKASGHPYFGPAPDRHSATYAFAVSGQARDMDPSAPWPSAAGYTRRQVLDVVLGVGMKTLSNYTNHIAHTPLDPAWQNQEWSR